MLFNGGDIVEYIVIWIFLVFGFVVYDIVNKIIIFVVEGKLNELLDFVGGISSKRVSSLWNFFILISCSYVRLKILFFVGRNLKVFKNLICVFLVDLLVLWICFSGDVIKK